MVRINGWVNRRRMLLLVALVAGMPLARATEQGPAPTESLLFEKDVLPILTAHCLKCHGDEKRKGELDL